MIKTTSSNRMQTGPYVVKSHPNTTFTFNDNTKVAEVEPSSTGFDIVCPIYSPKGPTNRWIYIGDENLLSKYEKLFGKPQTVLYGPFATYCYEGLKGGFGASILNMAPADAKHANVCLGFSIKQELDAGGSPVNKTLYCKHITEEDRYVFSWNQEDITSEGEGDEKEVVVPSILAGFFTYFLDNVGSDFDPQTVLSTTKVNLELPEDSDPAKLDIQLPLMGLFYEGASNYGNNYRLTISDSSEKVNDTYQIYKGVISDIDTKEFEFDFTLFNIVNNGSSTAFSDNVNLICKMKSSANTSIQLFRPYMASRKLSNSINAVIDKTTKLIVDNLIAKIKVQYPSFDENLSESNLEEFTGPTLAYGRNFDRGTDELGRTVETAFSKTTPWKELKVDTGILKHVIAPRTLVFGGGYSGKLADKLETEEFDMGMKVNEEDETPIFEQMLNDAFSGVTDDSIFDPAIVRDGIIFADKYPWSTQIVLNNLTRYLGDTVTYMNTVRCDLTVFMTPQEEIKKVSDVIIKWSSALEKELGFEGANYNIKPFIGRGMFNDYSTGGQSNFAFFYNYLGSGSSLMSWLKSGTKNPFASGSYSDVSKLIEGTEEMLPNMDQREELTKKCINYYKRKTDMTIALGEDTCILYGQDSGLKNTTTTIVLNRISRLIYLIARDNSIIDPSKDVIDNIVRKMTERISTYIKHFDSVEIKGKISQHKMEQGRNVVLYDVTVKKGKFSKTNRVEVNVENADSTTN